MNVTHEDFIGIYEDVYPDGYCEHLINEFERLVANGAGSDRINSENAARHRKNDMQLELNLPCHVPYLFDEKSSVGMFFDGLQACYEDYAQQFSVLQDSRISASTMKMQRSSPGQGYHIWHGEQNNGESGRRGLVYTLYLNTLEDGEGGETEFLYQRKRIRPKANTMLLWPAAFTHAHRGNVVMGDQSKYIVTGWFYYE